MNADKSDSFSGFLCAGGEGKEESCYVRNKTTVDYEKNTYINSSNRNNFNNDCIYLFNCRLH